MKSHGLQFQQVYLSKVDTSELPPTGNSNYRRINQMRNSLLVSLQKPNKVRNTSFILELNELPQKQRRNSFQEGVTGKKLAKLNCYYPSTICAQHLTQKLKIDNKAVLRKAVKKASLMMATVKYWKNQSNNKIEVPPMIKSLYQRNSCLSDRNLLTVRCTKRGDQPLVLLNQYRIRNNERLIQYGRDRTADKTKSVSHHASIPTLHPFSTRYSIQNVHIRVKQ